jgi:hypothetical protein
VKLAAVLLVVGLVATANLAAAERQRRRDRAAADRVLASAVLTSTLGRLGLGYVDLTISVSNAGPPLRVRPPRLDAPGYLVTLTEPVPGAVATGATQLLAVRLTAPCRSGRVVRALPEDAGFVVPVQPPSQRVQDLVVAVESAPLQALAEQACAFQPPDVAAQPVVDDVHLEPYAVTFRLTLENRSDQPFRLMGLAGQGLALGAVGGLPTDVAPRSSVLVPVRLSIPACAQLPEPLDAQRIDALPFGAFELELADVAGRQYSLPYLTDADTPLYAAIRSLARKICPRRTF